MSWQYELRILNFLFNLWWVPKTSYSVYKSSLIVVTTRWLVTFLHYGCPLDDENAHFLWISLFCAVHFRVILLVQTTGFPKPFEGCWWLNPICALQNYSSSPPWTFEWGNWMFRSSSPMCSWKVSYEYMCTAPSLVAMPLALMKKHVLKNESSPIAETWDQWAMGHN